MSGIWLAAAALVTFALGYRFYSKFIAEKIYRLDPDYQTPAHSQEDGQDYVPTNKWIVLGHHFTSIAGAAPIVGPAIAIYWGWGLHYFGLLWEQYLPPGCMTLARLFFPFAIRDGPSEPWLMS